MKKSFAKLLAAALVFALLTGCTGTSSTNAPDSGSQEQQEDPVAEESSFTIKLPYDYAEGHFESDLLMNFFAPEVETRSNGTLKVECYPGGILGTQEQIYEGVRNGMYEMAIIGVIAQDLMPQVAAFQFPFLFSDFATAKEVLIDEGYGWKLLEGSEEHGFKVLSLNPVGFRVMTLNEKIESIDGFKGYAVDLLIAEGAKVIFSETAELIGAEETITKRTVSNEVACKLSKSIQNMIKKINDYGVDILGSEPSYGNIKQGLTTIEEKSMGAIAKVGSTKVLDVLDYAQTPESGAGLYFMDGSSLSPLLYTGMIAAGAQIQLHSFGGGLCARSRNLSTYPSSIPIYPVIKIMGSTHDDCAIPYFDVFAGGIIRGEKSIHEVGQEIYDEILEVASGKMTFTEREITYREMLQFYADGLIM